MVEGFSALDTSLNRTVFGPDDSEHLASRVHDELSHFLYFVADASIRH